MSRSLNYFAYGSNLHPLRLGRRTPGCRPLGKTSIGGYDLRFHKRSDPDGSAKADAFYTGQPSDGVHGVVYAMDAAEIPVLDAIEGLGWGGYKVRTATVSVDAARFEVFLYTARPSHIDATLAPFRWYRDLVWRGALWQAMPEDYVERIRRVNAVDDPNAQREQGNRAVLEVMNDWHPEQGFELP